MQLEINILLGWVEPEYQQPKNNGEELDKDEYVPREIDKKIAFDKKVRDTSNMKNIINLEDEMIQFYSIHHKISLDKKERFGLQKFSRE